MLTLSNAKRYLGLTDKSISIVGNGTIATVTMENHNYKTGDQVEITGTTDYDGVKVITRINAESFKFNTDKSTTKTGFVVPYDFVLGLMIAGVDEYIKNYTNVTWVDLATESNKIMDCPEDGVIYVPKMPLASVSAVRISYDRDFVTADKYTDLTEDEYIVYPELGRVELLGSAAAEVYGQRNSVRISYATGTIPNGITMAAYELLAYYFRTWNDKAQNVTSRSAQGDQIFFSKNIPDSIKELLNPYVRELIGGGLPRQPRNIYF